VSVMTLRKMASANIDDADALLEKWRLALARGDFTTEQASPIVDALLELRTAACLLASAPNRQRTKKEKV
jgi:hypothetical protein